MDDFGGKLRQARERRGISLRQIAASTKISAAALEALERNDISKLPGGIFSRAFVRSYAVEVGLDPDDTVREFLERFNQEAPPTAEAVAADVPEAGARVRAAAAQGGASSAQRWSLIAVPRAGARPATSRWRGRAAARAAAGVRAGTRRRRGARAGGRPAAARRRCRAAPTPARRAPAVGGQ